LAGLQKLNPKMNSATLLIVIVDGWAVQLNVWHGYSTKRIRSSRDFAIAAQRIIKIISQALDVQIQQIEAAIEILKAEAASPKKDARVVQVMKHEDSRKVFIVHGHDVTLKYEIAHTLQNAGLDVTILHEQANQGRTMLEKFADHAAEAGFAVVLLTADDVGSAGRLPNYELLKPRPRQNVVFELGFFFGLLGRGRVCALYEAGVELPSDILGLGYVKYDSAGRWKQDVAKRFTLPEYQ
jgi:predicted nucleotide-binding protein